MRATHALVGAIALIGCGDGAVSIDLFNGRDLDGWDSWLQASGKNNDTLGVFRIDDGMLHVLGVDLSEGQFELGYLATQDEYDDFHLHLEYRWGTRRFVSWGPDSGVFVATVGPDAVWPRSLECQIAAGDTGSMYAFDRTTMVTMIDPAIASPTYLDAGVAHLAAHDPGLGYARVARSAASAGIDSLTDWNTVDMTMSGGDVEIVVNGHTTFRGTQLSQPSLADPDDPASNVPLTRGRIAIQNEGAEVFYRNIRIESPSPRGAR